MKLLQLYCKFIGRSGFGVRSAMNAGFPIMQMYSIVTSIVQLLLSVIHSFSRAPVCSEALKVNSQLNSSEHMCMHMHWYWTHADMVYMRVSVTIVIIIMHTSASARGWNFASGVWQCEGEGSTCRRLHQSLLSVGRRT